MRRSCLAILAIAALSPCAGADEPYMDDRSDAASLVRSLYNAVNRHEYARAYDYFTAPPAKTFDAYVQGYEGTARVDVITGRVKSDGAAGSVFYAVPTAVRARDGAGKTIELATSDVVTASKATIELVGVGENTQVLRLGLLKGMESLRGWTAAQRDEIDGLAGQIIPRNDIRPLRTEGKPVGYLYE